MARTRNTTGGFGTTDWQIHNSAARHAARSEAGHRGGVPPGPDNHGRARLPGVPNCVLNNDDFFYYLQLAWEIPRRRPDAGGPRHARYGVPNGVLNNDDFFYLVIRRRVLSPRPTRPGSPYRPSTRSC